MKDAKLYADHYAAGKHPQPLMVMSSDPPPAHYLAWAKFIYAMYCGGACATQPRGLYRKTDIGTLRAYARGEQPTSKYRNLVDVCVKEGKVGNTELGAGAGSLLNISFDNVRYFPKYGDLCVAKVTENEYEPVVRAMDSEASFERRKTFFLAKLATDQRMQKLYQTAGVVPPSAQKYAGMSSNDINTTAQLGGIQLSAESLMADVIGTAMDQSEWATLVSMLVTDIKDVNYCGFRVCSYGDSVRLEYADAAGLIFPSSPYPDHRDDQFVASIRKTDIATLRSEFGVPEKELYLIAKAFGGLHSNNSRQYGTAFSQRVWREEFAAANNYQVYDHFAVEVMDFEFICSKAEAALVGLYQNPEAESRVQEIGGTAYREDRYSTQYTYKGTWVIGSDIVLGTGMCDSQEREGDPGRKKARLSIRIWSGDGPSITERCISVIDDVQMAVLKIRLLIANLPPGPRFMIDMSVLENAIQFGKDTYDMKDMLQMFGATGKLFIRSKSEFGSEYGGSQKSPLIPIESGVQEDFNILSQQIAMGIDMIRQSTGMNEIADGTGNPSDVLNGVAKGMQASSNNALKPLVLGLHSLHQQAYNTIVRKYQVARLHNPVTVKRWVLDASHFTILELPSNIPMYDFHVKARLLPSQEEIAMVMQSLLQKQQEGMVNGGDAVIVMQMLRDRDVVKAQVYLDRAVEAKAALAHERQIQLINEQSKANAESAQASEMARMKTVLAEKDAEAKMLELEDGFDIKKGKRDHGYRMTEIAAKGDATSRTEVVKKVAESENVAAAA